MQGFNMGRYVPPEHEGVRTANSLNNKHALGSRGAKAHLGILTARFEMPFPIWCTTCPKPTIIGQGVRFNAEKKKVGNYYSTLVYAFRMKHVACGGWIEIRTDPKNTAYVVTEGARRRDLGEDVVKEGDREVLTAEEREKMRENAFANLEDKTAEVERAQGAKKRIEDLYEVQEQWEDPYERNRRLRATFRVGRKQRERDADVTGKLQDKMSLGIDLLPATDEDVLRTSLIDFGDDKDASAVLKQPLFKDVSRKDAVGASGSKKSKLLKTDVKAAQAKEAAASLIRDNTRARLDPFLATSSFGSGSRLNLGVKRRRSQTELDAQNQLIEHSDGQTRDKGFQAACSKAALVDYGSDSE